MEQISPELIQMLAQIGGAPAVLMFLGFLFFRRWNGAGEKIAKIDEGVVNLTGTVTKLQSDFVEFRTDTASRLTRVETVLEERKK
jgi:hypothetical protein